jgi:hypothetical protein
MGTKARARQQAFRERVANYSTRVSARGFGFPDMWRPEMELLGDLTSQLDSMIETLRAVAQSDGADRKAQVNRLRGSLGHWASKIGDRRYWDNSQGFYTVARAVLPQEVIDQIMVQVEAARDLAAMGYRDRILRALDETKEAAR